MIGQTTSVVPSLVASQIIWQVQENQPSVTLPLSPPAVPVVQYYNIAFPSFIPVQIIWPIQRSTLGTVSLQNQTIATTTVQYYVLTSVVVTAIIKWNIGIPFIGQIRQTALDRMDFAY